MRVGILASEMQRSPTGVGRFLRGLLEHASACRPEWRWVLYFQGEPWDNDLFEGRGYETTFFGRSRRHPVRFEQLDLGGLVDRDLDVFFSPAYSLPRGLHCRSVVAIHDLSFEMLPADFGLKERWRRRLLARRAARSADRVLTISPLVARQIEELYGVEESRIGVLPLGVDDHLFSPRDAASASQRDDGAVDLRDPFTLYVGSVLPRRRLDVVLEALSRLSERQPAPRLVIAGENRLRHPEDLDRWIGDFGVQDRVTRLGWVADGLLVRLMESAQLVFYLSTYEGYGLPPVESLAVGTPVVTSPGLALDHLWPDYPYRCRGITVEEVVRVVNRVLDDEEERASVRSRGRELARALSWRGAAESFVLELEKAVGS